MLKCIHILVGVLLMTVQSAVAGISYSGGTYSQNFNTLASPVANYAWADDTTISGWYASMTGASPPLPGQYRAGAGTDNTGALYSFGSLNAIDRALGSIASGSTGSIFYGAMLTNNTGNTLTEFTLSYDGEQWRTGGSATASNSVAQKLVFAYGVGATALTSGTYTGVAALDFTSPIFNTISPSSLDGNSAANRAALSATITGLNWGAGASLWLRWTDTNDANNDHGLAIDNLSFEANGSVVTTDIAVPEPSSVAIWSLGALGCVVGACRRRKRA